MKQILYFQYYFIIQKILNEWLYDLSPKLCFIYVSKDCKASRRKKLVIFIVRKDNIIIIALVNTTKMFIGAHN